MDISSKRKDGSLAFTSNKCTCNNPRKRMLSLKKVEQSTKFTANVERFKNRLIANNSNAAWFTNVEKSESLVDEASITVNKMCSVRR